MFYDNLGGTFGMSKFGNQTAVGGVMLNDIQLIYWSGTEFDSFNKWHLDFRDGDQSVDINVNQRVWAWAVRDGDVVPEPVTLALLGLGLAGLGFSRRKRIS